MKIGFYTITASVFLFPLFFLPITSEFYDFNKQILLIFSSSLLLLIWALDMVAARQVRLIRSPFGVPLLLIVGSWFLSTILMSPSKFHGLFDPTQAGTIFFLAAFFLTAVNIVKTRQQLETLFYTLLSSISLLAVFSLVWTSNLLNPILPLPFLRSVLWTPTGNSLHTLGLLLGFIPVLLVILPKEKPGTAKFTVLAISALVCIAAAGLTGYRLVSSNETTKPTKILPQSTSWAIALESLKASPLIGTGPATYLSDFTRYRPGNFNLNPLWSTRFTGSNNYYLELLSTLGLVGFLAYLFLIQKTFQTFWDLYRTTSQSPLHTLSLGLTLSLLVVFVSQIFLPISITTQFFLITLLTLLVITLKVMGSSLVSEANIELVSATETHQKSPLLAWLVLIAVIAIISPVGYALSRIYKAEYLFQAALKSASANDGKKTYDTLIEVIKINPQNEIYRVAYSQINLLLANSLANKSAPTEADRATISKLAQQAIREAKNAVALFPTNVTNVENLANVYRSLIGAADGADTWTTSTFDQAISLDPANPNLRITQGGVYFSLKKYDEAAKYFQQATELKPDLPNAYYNLAAALKEKKDYSKAAAAMDRVVALVDKSSPDYSKAIAELENLKKLAGQTSPAPTAPSEPAKSNLESPQLLPSPKISPISLPSDLAPATQSATPSL